MILVRRPAAQRHKVRALLALRSLMQVRGKSGTNFNAGATIMRALEGESIWHATQRFNGMAVASRVGPEATGLHDILSDHQTLLRLPPDTLGHHYVQLMIRDKMTIESLLDMTTMAYDRGLSETERQFDDRMRISHDLSHVLTGYAADELGEICLLAFRTAQLFHLGATMLCLLGTLKTVVDYPALPALRAIHEGWRRGRTADWIYGAHWETLLATPIETVRASLRLPPAPLYDAVVAVGKRPRRMARTPEALA